MRGRYLGAWAAYVGITFLLGFVWHLVVFEELYRELAIYSRLDDPIIPLGLLSMAIQGVILAWLYPRVASGRGVVREGLAFGIVFGVLLASSAVLAEAAKQRVTSLPLWLVLEGSYYVIQFGLSGLAIAAVFGRRRAAGAETPRPAVSSGVS